MRPSSRGILQASFALLLLGFSGCYNPSKSVDQRGALEQQLTRTACARAVYQLEFPREVLRGKTWKIEVAAPDAHEKDWIRNFLRRRLVNLGVEISRDEKANLPIIEANVVFAGSDIDNLAIGLPIALPGTPVMIGFYQSISLYGRAAMDLTYWGTDGKIITQGVGAAGTAHYTTVYFLTLIGPFSFTDTSRIRTSGRVLELGDDAVGGS